MAEITITSSNFEEEVINSDIPVVLDFWATWCGPCKMIAPILTELAEENADKIKLCKINVDTEPELAMKFKIMSIPTIVLMEKGEIIKTEVGYMSKERLTEVLGL